METVEQALPRNGCRSVELEMVQSDAAGGGDHDWDSLRSNPDYRADWYEHGAAASFVESSGLPLRTQSEADLKAARWGLLAWEDPRTRSRFSPFWVDGKMVQALAVKPRESASAMAVLARETGISFTGLRLRDGSLVLKAKRRAGWSSSGSTTGIRLTSTGWDSNCRILSMAFHPRPCPE